MHLKRDSAVVLGVVALGMGATSAVVAAADAAVAADDGFAATYNRATTTLYPSISPFGINGGFYYIRGVLEF